MRRRKENAEGERASERVNEGRDDYQLGFECGLGGVVFRAGSHTKLFSIFT
jgi:hypothetical protein